MTSTIRNPHLEDITTQAHDLFDQLDDDTRAIPLSVLRTLSQPRQVVTGSFTQVLGLAYTAIGDGRCSATLEVQPHLLNPLGIAHGGVAFALADSTCGGAALSALGERRLVTQDMQIRYHAPARAGTLVAHAETVHKGSRTITTQCRITQNDVLIASVTGTFAILSPDEITSIKESLANS